MRCRIAEQYLEPLPEEAMVQLVSGLVRAGETAWRAGKLEVARTLLEQAHEVFVGAGETRAALLGGEPERAVPHLERALSLAAASICPRRCLTSALDWYRGT